MSASVHGREAGRAFPVSVKGVTVQAGKVLLLENERAEWELPGGKLELGEDPADCVVREISEETGWKVTAGSLLDCWQYHISQGRDVVIITYGCHVISTGPPVVSHEHKRAGLFDPDEVRGLVMPEGYKRSVAAWFARLNGQAVPLPGPDWAGAVTGAGHRAHPRARRRTARRAGSRTAGGSRRGGLAAASAPRWCGRDLGAILRG